MKMNMAHCRFHNTNIDLKDCLENLHEKVSPEENESRIKLFETCREIMLEMGVEVDYQQFKDAKKYFKEIPINSD